MEEWVERALKRWPNVPALYGWLKLDRRGRWLIKGETISRPQIIDVINRNYAADERGCWYFQNGPQRGYMQLERAPLLIHIESDRLIAHTQLTVSEISAVFLDEDGGMYLQTEQGPSALLDSDLDWALARMEVGGRPVDETQVAAALALPSGAKSEITIRLLGNAIPIYKLNRSDAPVRLKFVLDPKPQ